MDRKRSPQLQNKMKSVAGTASDSVSNYKQTIISQDLDTVASRIAPLPTQIMSPQ